MSETERLIGRFRLQPGRQLLLDGLAVPIGRKAFDVLSVLAEADGGLVTKDELIAAVWPRAIVEDNAVQAQIAALRKILGVDAALLVTVRGRGYRLNRTASQALSPAAELGWGPPGAQAPLRASRSHRRVRRRILAGGAALLAGVIGSGGYALWHGRADHDDLLVRLSPVEIHGRGADIRDFADGLKDVISSDLSKDRIQFEAGAGPGPDQAYRRVAPGFTLVGGVWRLGSSFEVHMQLVEATQDRVIWSETFKDPASSPRALEATIGSRLAEATFWAGQGRSGRVKLDPTALAAFIAGREATTGLRDDTEDLVEYRKVVAQAPGFTWGRSAIAASEGFRFAADPQAAGMDRTQADGRMEAQQALTLDPHNGEAYLALELLTPRPDWGRREAYLVKGAAQDPDFGPVALMEGRLLWAAGEGQAATPWFELAHSLAPLHNGAIYSLALNEAAVGRIGQGRSFLAGMASQWPDHAATRAAQFWMDLLAGDLTSAQALLARADVLPLDMDQVERQVWRTSLAALGARDGPKMAGAARRVKAAVATGSLSHGKALLLLAMLGDVDGSFEQAQLYKLQDPASLPYLFMPPSAPLRRDHRFMLVAQRLGLTDYWMSTRRWPDFCKDASLPYDCRAEALALSRAGHGARRLGAGA